MKSIFCLIAVLLAYTAQSQQTDVNPLSLKEDLLKKSKNQKKAALIMLGGGAVLIATAVIIPQGESEGWQLDPISGISESHSNDGIKGACALTGVLSMLGSIPLFIASSRNKKKAMSLSFKNETAPQLYQNSWVQKSFPALSFKISL